MIEIAIDLNELENTNPEGYQYILGLVKNLKGEE